MSDSLSCILIDCGLGTAQWSTSVEWMEKHPGTAAWVQAIGLLITFAVTSLLAIVTLRRSQRAAWRTEIAVLDHLSRVLEAVDWEIRLLSGDQAVVNNTPTWIAEKAADNLERYAGEFKVIASDRGAALHLHDISSVLPDCVKAVDDFTATISVGCRIDQGTEAAELIKERGVAATFELNVVRLRIRDSYRKII